MSPQFHYHVFSLPRELLDTLVPRDIVNRPSTPQPHDLSPPDHTLEQQTATAARACNICLGATFVDVDSQRTHYRSDWHRYNVKMRLNGSQPVSDAHFSGLVDQLEDSLSGSVSSSDEESDESDSIAALVDKARQLGRSPSPDEHRPSAPQTALTWFHSPPSTQIGVYKVLFTDGAHVATYLDQLRAMQESTPSGRTWALFMTAGGHFAGAIVRVSRPAEADGPGEFTKKGKPKKPVPEIEVLKHKTFHRYTTRRKQGGAQSTNDNAKTKAVSAGAMLRRYGEQALRDDIRNLLSEWAEDIEDCERVFIRASVSNRKIFLDYEGAVLQKTDDRLRTFPFPTRRPTQSELTRCLQELVRGQVSHLTEDALRAQDEAYLASLPKPKSKPTVPAPPAESSKLKDVPPKLTPEEECSRERWTRLLDIVSKGRLDAMKLFWTREEANIGSIDTRIPDWAEEKGGTLLQVAAQAGQEEMTRWLLEEARANPTLDVPTDHVYIDGGGGEQSDDEERVPSGPRRTAYDIANTRAVRNVFRRCAAASPDWWDWLGVEAGARVPSVLTKQMEEGRDEKKKVRRKGLKDKIKDREAKEKLQESSRSPSPAPEPQRSAVISNPPTMGPRKLGGAGGSTEGVAGLSPEMRARIERERRARAAEARMQALSGKR